MAIKLLLTIFVIIPVLILTYANGDDGQHHRVIIHVPYKVHTIHHTILKHVHHHDKEDKDRYEVLGYSIGKAIDPLQQHHQHQFEPVNQHHHKPHSQILTHHNLSPSLSHPNSNSQPSPDLYFHHAQPHPELLEHEFSGGNELGQGNDWVPTHGHDWAPSYGSHEFDGEGGDVGHHFHDQVEHLPSHEFHRHKRFSGYD